LRVPVQAIGQDLAAVAHLGTGGQHAWNFADNAFEVLHRQGGRAPSAPAHTAPAKAAGENGDHVLPKTRHLGLHLGLGAVANAEGRNHRGIRSRSCAAAGAGTY